MNYSNSSFSSSSSSFDENVLIGKTLNNKYLVIYKIGSGAYSTVWLCLNTSAKLFYAVKVLYPDGYNVGSSEIELLKKIKKSKCQYFNHIIDDFTHTMNGEDYCCIVFELLAGSLYDIMKYGKYKKGLALPIVKKIIFQLVTAMNELTGKFNILHTDIKPENILVTGHSYKISEIISVCNSNKKKLNKKGIVELQKKFDEIAEKFRDNSDSDSNSDNNSNSNSNSNIELLADEYINENNIKVKLSDFGNCLNLEKKNYRIQTRYYRAPEIILECEFSEKCDTWSIGCLIYELLTGKTLFDPEKKRRFSTNRAHLYEMMVLLGEIPEKLINKSNKKIDFFKKNGLLKGNDDEIKYISLETKLRDLLTNDDLVSTNELLLSLLQYEPNLRPDLKDLLNSDWLKSSK